MARLAEAKVEPLLACLEALQRQAPQDIAANIIACAHEVPAANSVGADDNADTLAPGPAGAENLPSVMEVA